LLSSLFPLCHFSSHVNTFLFLHQLKVTPESIELAREEGAKDISSRNPHWLWDYIEIKGGVGFISFDFKKWLERHLR